jgi:hypothetical protein
MIDFPSVETMTDYQLLREHDTLVPLAIRLQEVCTEMSRRAKEATDKLLAADDMARRLDAILKQ